MHLAAELPRVESLIFVRGTGRSGSTLLSHAFNASDLEQVLVAFDRDAQAGTDLAREDVMKGNPLWLTDQQVADIHEVLQRHPVINTPDFTLPGTLEL